MHCIVSVAQWSDTMAKFSLEFSLIHACAVKIVAWLWFQWADRISFCVSKLVFSEKSTRSTIDLSSHSLIDFFICTACILFNITMDQKVVSLWLTFLKYIAHSCSNWKLFSSSIHSLPLAILNWHLLWFAWWFTLTQIIFTCPTLYIHAFFWFITFDLAQKLTETSW